MTAAIKAEEAEKLGAYKTKGEIMNGYKTIIGAAFLAITSLASTLEPILSPDTVLMIQAATGAIGAFLTAVGIGHKIDKLK